MWEGVTDRYNTLKLRGKREGAAWKVRRAFPRLIVSLFCSHGFSPVFLFIFLLCDNLCKYTVIEQFVSRTNLSGRPELVASSKFSLVR